MWAATAPQSGVLQATWPALLLQGGVHGPCMPVRSGFSHAGASARKEGAAKGVLTFFDAGRGRWQRLQCRTHGPMRLLQGTAVAGRAAGPRRTLVCGCVPALSPRLGRRLLCDDISRNGIPMAIRGGGSDEPAAWPIVSSVAGSHGTQSLGQRERLPTALWARRHFVLWLGGLPQ